MADELVLSIAIAIAIFVITQVGLKYVIEPAVLLKQSIGKVSFIFLSNQSKLTNGIECEELQKTIKDCAASLIEKYQSIPFYRFIGPFFGLPRRDKVFESAKCLNMISYHLHSGSELNASARSRIIYENMKEVKLKLKVITTYEGL